MGCVPIRLFIGLHDIMGMRITQIIGEVPFRTRRTIFFALQTTNSCWRNQRKMAASSSLRSCPVSSPRPIFSLLPRWEVIPFPYGGSRRETSTGNSDGIPQREPSVRSASASCTWLLPHPARILSALSECCPLLRRTLLTYNFAPSSRHRSVAVHPRPSSRFPLTRGRFSFSRMAAEVLRTLRRASAGLDAC